MGNGLLPEDAGRVFVAYSSVDRRFVGPVVALLRARERVFHDVDSIRPGQKWRTEIEEAIGAASLVLVFWCEHASRSNEVRHEYQTADSTGKDILPVLFDSTPLERPLDEYQWVDFRNLVNREHGAARARRVWVALVAALVLTAGLVGGVALTRGGGSTLDTVAAPTTTVLVSLPDDTGAGPTTPELGSPPDTLDGFPDTTVASPTSAPFPDPTVAPPTSARFPEPSPPAGGGRNVPGAVLAVGVAVAAVAGFARLAALARQKRRHRELMAARLAVEIDKRAG